MHTWVKIPAHEVKPGSKIRLRNPDGTLHYFTVAVNSLRALPAGGWSSYLRNGDPRRGDAWCGPAETMIDVRVD